MVLRYLLRNWFQNVARQKLREKVMEAARDELASTARASQAEKSPDRDRPCHVGVVFALGIEAGGLEDLLSGVVTTRAAGFLVRQGGLEGRLVAVVQSGSGREAAGRATEAMITGHQPDWVISAGFAGGLDPRLKRHDLVMADSLVDTEGNRLTIDLKVDPAALAQTPGVHVGRLLTADRIVRLPDEKRSLGEQHQALAVDMETFAVAEVCRRQHVRFLTIRIINDTVGEELPPDLDRLMKQKRAVRKLGAVVGAIWNRPGSLKDMYKLKEDALGATDRLAKFLVSTIRQLTPRLPAE